MPLTLSGTTGEIFPSWTTAGRPSTPTAGQTGYNSTLNTLERYNGTTWGPIVTTADTATVSQTMLASGVAGNGPMAFATMSGNQTISGSTFTKVNFDTATSYGTATNGWDATNKRFTPNVAGYYFVTGFVYNTGSAGWLNQSLVSIYKNGSADTRTYDTNGAVYGMPINGFVYLNGTTDYAEVYVYSSGANLTISSGPSFLRCSLLRAG